MFIPDNLELYEILPKDFYEKMLKELGPNNMYKLWMMFDQPLLVTYDLLRKRYGTAVLNTWYWGGVNQLRGWRPIDCTVGAVTSQHKFGRAFDIVFKYYSAEEIRQDIIKNPNKEEYKRIACIEMKVGWLHIDTGNRMQHLGQIQQVYP